MQKQSRVKKELFDGKEKAEKKKSSKKSPKRKQEVTKEDTEG